VNQRFIDILCRCANDGGSEIRTSHISIISLILTSGTTPANTYTILKRLQQGVFETSRVKLTTRLLTSRNFGPDGRYLLDSC
jgi:hypothetical protein